MNRLNKQQALLLLPAVIDNEVTEQERAAFYEYIKHDPDVEREFYAMLQVKRLLSQHLPKKPAPDYLKDRIMQQLHEEIESEKLRKPGTPLNQIGTPLKLQSTWSSVLYSGLRYIAAASIILLLTLMVVQLLERSTGSVNTNIFVMENITAQHFTNFDGGLIDPDFATESPAEAESYLAQHYGFNLKIPDLEGARFAGIVLADFHDGMELPLLQYIQDSIDEHIYIFAVDLKRLNQSGNMIRDENAAKSCTTQTDYFVNDINGTHVVSWLWDNNWYSAVSNHNGHDLAAIVGPLNRD
ncbi:anti-sigma factor [Rhodohalobacter halophilus]|uniref:anti-sigma factor n=1 Tax=Rhodohalobacter halophilus TaxID=1812810 RepID=UPI00083FA829|nr:hypothetical protein [Rhodohalobacter halophilus]